MVEGTRPEARRLSGVSKRQVAVAVGLGLIVLLGAFLRFYELGAYSIGNTYYAATVQSMLTSWHNFFFASFEPGGSVTVDKPPLGFWIQAVSAYFLGVNGFALALPQALAGVLSIPLLYLMVKRQFGVWAGLIAALVLAITPVTVSTERNNTIDGLLVFVLLLATWAFLRAVRLGRFRYLLLGAFLVGLGFNIKMLQAFMPLPALYALYLLGAPHPWWKRILHLAGATVLLLAVSLSWAIAVDLTPPEDRPYIGSSDDNTVMELIVGHNGLSRLISMRRSAPKANVSPPSQPPSAGQTGQLPQNPPPPPNSGQPPAQSPQNQPPQQLGPMNQPANPPVQPGGGRSQEVGEAGVLRLFTEPLVTEAGWLLPLALLGIPLILVVLGWQWPFGSPSIRLRLLRTRLRTPPLSDKHLALVLWAGWLLPEVAYFTFTSGLFHAYYLIMLGPPLAALVGATAWAVWRVCQQRRWLGWMLLALLVGVAIVFQMVTLWNYPNYGLWIAPVAIILFVLGLGILALTEWRNRPWLGKAVVGMTLVAAMVAPLAWSGLTALNTHPNVALPRSGPDTGQAGRQSMPDILSPPQERILDHLLANTDPDSYLVATVNAREASPYILETLRPVLTFGGFSGSDNVVDVAQLAQMVADGELRFVLADDGLARQKREIGAWLTDNCTTVVIPGATQSGLTNNQPFRPGGPGQANVLYDCGKG
jgi:4-amino-4-deoxy-L-arabinose transferase-like glycosyltransferase